MSCKKCVRKVKEEDGKCYCIHCKEYCNGEIHYKLNINVVDGTECVTLLFWDTQSRGLIRKTTRELKDKIVKVKYFTCYKNIIKLFHVLLNIFFSCLIGHDWK